MSRFGGKGEGINMCNGGGYDGNGKGPAKLGQTHLQISFLYDILIFLSSIMAFRSPCYSGNLTFWFPFSYVYLPFPSHLSPPRLSFKADFSASASALDNPIHCMSHRQSGVSSRPTSSIPRVSNIYTRPPSLPPSSTSSSSTTTSPHDDVLAST